MNTINQKIQHALVIPSELQGMRLDQALTKLLPQYSRMLMQKWIKAGALLLNQKTVKAKTLVIGGEEVVIEALLEPQTSASWTAQPIALNILHEDEALLIINKPAGLIVHPGSGNPDHTLLNALLYHAPNLALLPRAGLIHRLDKDTSGLLVIAKTLPAYTSLTKQLKARTMRREYQAIVHGVMISGGSVDAPIGRHPLQRKRMAIIDTGRVAITHYRIAEKYRAHTRLKVCLETGRTHQIRVHMAHIHHPLVGDPVYGGRLRLPKGATAEAITALRQFKRQALHADTLALNHPLTQERVEWKIELPSDLNTLIQALRHDQSPHPKP